MTRSFLFGFSFIASVFLLVDAQSAAACTCAADPVLRPSSNDTEVPANTKLWVGRSSFCSELSVSVNDEPIETTLLLAVGELAVYAPSVQLDLGDEVKMSCDSPYYVGESTFTVTRDTETEAPNAPTMQQDERIIDNGSSCGESEFVPYTNTSADAVVVLSIGVKEPEPLGTTKIMPNWAGAFVQSEPGEQTWTAVGDPPCSVSTWQFRDGNDAKDIRWAAFDLAGNGSTWSEPLALSASSSADSCSMTPRPRGSVSWSSLLLLGGALSLGLCARRKR